MEGFSGFPNIFTPKFIWLLIATIALIDHCISIKIY